MIDVLFRADDGPGIGAGHLMRCMALAEAVSAAGGRAHLLASASSPLHRSWPASGARIEVHGLRIGGAEDREETLRFANDLDADWLVADGYGFDVDWLEALAQQCRLLYLDDLGGRDARTAMVLNQNAGSEIRYRCSYSRAGRVLLGLNWFLLRGAWQMATPCPEPGHLLITLGGDDRDNLALNLMRELLSYGGPFHADVVSSAPEQGFQLASELALANPGRFELHRAPTDLVPLMERAAVVICGGGVTPVEAASMGVPAVIMVLADNQLPGAEALATMGAARVVLPGERSPAEAARLALRFSAEKHERDEASACGRKLVDGKGAARVVAAMMEAMQ